MTLLGNGTTVIATDWHPIGDSTNCLTKLLSYCLMARYSISPLYFDKFLARLKQFHYIWYLIYFVMMSYFHQQENKPPCSVCQSASNSNTFANDRCERRAARVWEWNGGEKINCRGAEIPKNSYKHPNVGQQNGLQMTMIWDLGSWVCYRTIPRT